MYLSIYIYIIYYNIAIGGDGTSSIYLYCLAYLQPMPPPNRFSFLFSMEIERIFLLCSSRTAREPSRLPTPPYPLPTPPHPGRAPPGRRRPRTRVFGEDPVGSRSSYPSSSLSGWGWRGFRLEWRRSTIQSAVSAASCAGRR